MNNLNRFSSRRQRLDHAFLSTRLQGAKSYRRIAGYFRSSIFELVGEEIATIPKVQVVCNSELDAADVVVSKLVRETALKERWNEAPAEWCGLVEQTFVDEEADLYIVKVGKPDGEVLAGEPLEYTVWVYNLGLSDARNVLVRVTHGDDRWVVIVDDDGRGFDFEGRMSHEEMDRLRRGPVILKEHARAAGGSLAIQSQRGVGARVEITIPGRRHV